jgi:sRNA-binding regulator protein Hfq
MTNKEKLQQWFENEKKKGLVDVKLYPGNTSQSSIESFCNSILGFLEARQQNRRTRIVTL